MDIVTIIMLIVALYIGVTVLLLSRRRRYPVLITGATVAAALMVETVATIPLLADIYMQAVLAVYIIAMLPAIDIRTPVE